MPTNKNTSTSTDAGESKTATTGESGDKVEVKEPSTVSKEDFQKLNDDFKKYVEDTNDFIKGSSVVVNTLASDPTLRESFQEALKKQYGVVGEGQGTGQQSQQSQPKAQTDAASQATDGVNKRVDSIEITQREEIISEFENQMGISRLKPEEQKEARRQVESYLNDFGWSVKDVPLPSLRKNLERAYMGSVGVNKLREEGKLEGIASFRNNQAATMGSIPGGAPESQDQTPKLDEKQKKWAEKLGVDVEGAEKVYLNRDKEDTRIPKAEQEKNEGKN